LSFYHKVTSPIVIILKIEVSLDNHREVQFSNPEKGPKSEENDPVIRRLVTGLKHIHQTTVTAERFRDNYRRTVIRVGDKSTFISI